MFTITVGMTFKSIKQDGTVAKVTGVEGNAVTFTTAEGGVTTTTLKSVQRWWKPIENIVILAPVATPALTPVVTTTAGDYAWLTTLYTDITQYLERLEGVTYKLNPNGTTAVKVDGKSNFAEIKLQKKKLIVRVIQEATEVADTLMTNVIPSTYGWKYKTEIVAIEANDAKGIKIALAVSMARVLGI